MSNKYSWIVHAIVDHPWLNVAFLLVVTTFATIGHYDANLLIPKKPAQEANEPRSNRPLSRTRAQPSRSEGSRLSLSQADVLIVATSDAFFTPQGAESIRAVVAELESLDTVQSILWLDRVPMLNIFGMPEPVFPKSEASPQKFASAKRKAQEHPLASGQLMSPDGRTLMLLVQMNWLEVRRDEDCTQALREAAQRALAKHPGVSVDIKISGEVPMSLMIISTQRSNQLRYQIIAYCMIFGMAVVLFRGLIAVGIVAMAPIMGVYWTLGILHYFDFQDNPFNDVILPVMLSLIGFTDGVHMMVQIRKQRALGMLPKEATKKGLADVGLACVLTLLTTAIGFASLAWAHHEIVREFGWCCVIGIAISFTAVISIIPLLTASRMGQNLHVGHDRSIVDKNLAKIIVAVNFSIRNARWLSWMAIGLTLGCGLIGLTLRPDDRLSNSLPEGSEARNAMMQLDDAMGGLAVGQIQIRWSEDSNTTRDEIVKVIHEIDKVVAKDPMLGNPLSITRMLEGLPGDRPVEERSSMIELLPPPLKRAYLVEDERLATVTFRVRDTGIASYGPVFTRLEKELASLTDRYPAFDFRLEGRPVWRWRNLYQIVVDLASSLGGEAVIILGLFILAFRSIRLGLIAIVPNLFPLAVTACIAALMGLPLDIVAVCAFTICLGIAVDDTIHFLTRYIEERQTGKKEEDAVRDAFVGVGTGMIMTTVVLICGFSTVLFSETRDHRIFSWMGMTTMASALFGDLLLLPAMLVYFRKRR